MDVNLNLSGSTIAVDPDGLSMRTSGGESPKAALQRTLADLGDVLGVNAETLRVEPLGMGSPTPGSTAKAEALRQLERDAARKDAIIMELRASAQQGLEMKEWAFHLMAENEGLRKMLQTAEEQMEAQRSVLTEAEARANAFESERTSLVEKEESARKAMHEALGTQLRLEASFQAIEGARDAAALDAERSQQQLLILQEALAEADSGRDALLQDLDLERKRAAGLELDAAGAQRDAEMHRKRNEILSARVAQLEGVEAELKGAREELEASRSQVQRVEDLEKLASGVEAFREEARSARLELKAKEEEAFALQRSLDDVSNTLFATERELARAKVEAGQVEPLFANKSNQEKRLRELSEALQDLKARHAKLLEATSPLRERVMQISTLLGKALSFPETIAESSLLFDHIKDFGVKDKDINIDEKHEGINIDGAPSDASGASESAAALEGDGAESAACASEQVQDLHIASEAIDRSEKLCEAYKKALHLLSAAQDKALQLSEASEAKAEAIADREESIAQLSAKAERLERRVEELLEESKVANSSRESAETCMAVVVNILSSSCETAQAAVASLPDDCAKEKDFVEGEASSGGDEEEDSVPWLLEQNPWAKRLQVYKVKLESLMATLVQHVPAISASVRLQRKEIDDLEEEVQGLEAKLEDSRHNREKEREELKAQHQSELDAFASQYETQKAEIAKAGAEVGESLANIREQAQEGLDRANDENERLQNLLDASQSSQAAAAEAADKAELKAGLAVAAAQVLARGALSLCTPTTPYGSP